MKLEIEVGIFLAYDISNTGVVQNLEHSITNANESVANAAYLFRFTLVALLVEVQAHAGQQSNRAVQQAYHLSQADVFRILIQAVSSPRALYTIEKSCITQFKQDLLEEFFRNLFVSSYPKDLNGLSAVILPQINQRLDAVFRFLR